MKILHAPFNIAGQASIISRAQRKLGIQSDVMVFSQTYLEYENDIILNINTKPLASKFGVVLKNFLYCIRTYDIFHFHFGSSLLPFLIDMHILKLLGKPMLMHYWGSDVIQIDIAKKYTLLSEEELKEIFKSIHSRRRRKKIRRIESLANMTIVGDYSLQRYSPKSIVIRQAIDLSALQFVGVPTKENNINVVHAPTNRKIKGTHHVISVIDDLKRQGYNMNLQIVENMPNKEALEIYKKADIVIDDVLQGPYGIFAIESMALGKPVLGYVRNTEQYPGLPIMNTSPSSLKNNILSLFNNRPLRITLGKQGRAYVERHHDSLKIAQQLIDIYKTLS